MSTADATDGRETRGKSTKPDDAGQTDQGKTDRSTTDQKGRRSTQRRAARGSGLSAAKAARLAVEQVVELVGRDPEVVSSVQRTEEGWRVGIEVVETHRIPDSADILAVYEADIDADGDLLSYRRIRRYPRGRVQED